MASRARGPANLRWGAIVLVLLLLTAAAAPWLARNPNRMELDLALRPPSADHWFGTDALGRDLAARVVHGARVSLAVGLLAAAFSLLLGGPLGALAGYRGGFADALISRAIEAILCFPTLLLVLALLAASPPWLRELSDVLRIALMIPLGALVTILVRNVVGLRTFGFFLPMLIAITATRAGLGWTLSAFLLVIGLVYAVRALASPLRLLHFPLQGIMLTAAVLAVIGLAAWGALKGNFDLAQITFLPVVVLTIASERFSTIVEEEGLAQISDSTALEALVAQVIADNPDTVARYLDGKEGLLGWFVGQVMRETKGQANAQVVNDLFREKLGAIEKE